MVRRREPKIDGGFSESRTAFECDLLAAETLMALSLGGARAFLSTPLFTEDPYVPGSGLGSQLFPRKPRVCPGGTVSRPSPVWVPLWR